MKTISFVYNFCKVIPSVEEVAKGEGAIFSLVAGVMLECVYEALLNSPIQLSH